MQFHGGKTSTNQPEREREDMEGNGRDRMEMGRPGGAGRASPVPATRRLLHLLGAFAGFGRSQRKAVPTCDLQSESGSKSLWETQCPAMELGIVVESRRLLLFF